MGFAERESRGHGELDSPFPAIEKIVEELGYECVNAALVTEDGRPVLRVMIDSIGGINVSDCEMVSKSVSRWLDETAENAGPGERYYLEVSSPGVERPLFTPGDYARFKGREARVKTAELVDGRKNHVGFIAASDGESVTLDTEQGERNLRFAGITRAALVFRGLEPQPPKKPQKQPKIKKTVKATKKTEKENHVKPLFEEEH